MAQLIGNSSDDKQRLGKHDPTATNTPTIEEVLNAWFSMQSMSYQKKVDNYFFPEFLVNVGIAPVLILKSDKTKTPWLWSASEL
jgi:hypothetical protein